MISATSDRRLASRQASSDEVVMHWHNDPHPVRYGVLDRSDGGFRITSSLPVLSGTMGRVARLLPTGERLDQNVMVAWSRAIDGRWELGLRCI